MSIDAKRAIDMYAQGKSLQEVADQLDCTLQGVRCVLIKHGVARRPRGGNRTGIVLDEAVILGLYAEGASIESIAERFGVGMARVSKVVRRDHGPWMGTVQGDAHFRAVLSHSKVVEARVLRLRKRWSWARLVRWFGVPQTTLRKAVHGETWDHVPSLQRIRRGLDQTLLGKPVSEQIVALYTGGLSLREAAAQVEVSQRVVRMALGAHGVAIRRQRGRSTIEECAGKNGDAVRLYSGGMSILRVSKKLQMSQGSVRKTLVRAGCRLRVVRQKGGV
jgi:transposase